MLGLVEASTTLGVGTARSRMVKKAERMGANAVVGARYAGGSLPHRGDPSLPPSRRSPAAPPRSSTPRPWPGSGCDAPTCSRSGACSKRATCPPPPIARSRPGVL
jgi:hypothetical protein